MRYRSPLLPLIAQTAPAALLHGGVVSPSRPKAGACGRDSALDGGRAAVAGGGGYAAFKTGDRNHLRNCGEAVPMLFKRGGALGLMRGTDPSANPKRDKPVAGDLRLVVTIAKGKPMAALYRAVVSGSTNPVPFSSPCRTVMVDRVDYVSPEPQLATGGE